MIRVLIADDEALARQKLHQEISQHPEFEVIAEAAGGREALEKIASIRPDVVFLDIDMPAPNGLEVAMELACAKQAPLVVFVTAFNEYALEAFEAKVLDYVVKPFESERLTKTLLRIRECHASKKRDWQGKFRSLEKPLMEKRLLNKLTARRRGYKDQFLIDLREIYYFHARLTEVTVRTEKEELLVHHTLKDLLKILDPSRFVQTHKAYLVNLDKAEKIAPLFNRNYEMTLAHPERLKVPVSRRYLAALKARIQ